MKSGPDIELIRMYRSERFVRLAVCFISCVLLFPALALAGKPEMRFSYDDERFESGANAYRSLWAEEGDRIVAAMEGVTGLKFKEARIQVIVYEGISRSGFADSPMKMRASYPLETKRATLIHELGHRLITQLKKRPLELDEHRILFLVLYDIWVDLYGLRFANQQVMVEKRRRGRYDYKAAWDWALSQTKEKRSEKFRAILEDNQPEFEAAFGGVIC